MKTALLKNATGMVTVVHFAHEMDARALSHYRDAVFPGTEIIGECDPSALPSPHFRNCWRHDGNAVIVDMVLAREQHLIELRRERDAILLTTDALWLRAFERKDDLARVALEAKRQLLRDIPQMLLGEKPLDGAVCKALLSDCRTADDLESLVPAWPEL